MVKTVDLIVPAGDLSRMQLVLLDERFEDVVHLADRELSHDSKFSPQRLIWKPNKGTRHSRDSDRRRA